MTKRGCRKELNRHHRDRLELDATDKIVRVYNQLSPKCDTSKKYIEQYNVKTKTKKQTNENQFTNAHMLTSENLLILICKENVLVFLISVNSIL